MANCNTMVMSAPPVINHTLATSQGSRSHALTGVIMAKVARSTWRNKRKKRRKRNISTPWKLRGRYRPESCRVWGCSMRRTLISTSSWAWCATSPRQWVREPSWSSCPVGTPSQSSTTCWWRILSSEEATTSSFLCTPWCLQLSSRRYLHVAAGAVQSVYGEPKKLHYRKTNDNDSNRGCLSSNKEVTWLYHDMAGLLHTGQCTIVKPCH